MTISVGLDNSFNLSTKDSTYIIKNINGNIVHLFYGKKVRNFNTDESLKLVERCSFCPNPDPDDRTISFDTLPREYPTYGNSDFRQPSLEVVNNDGSGIADLKFQEYAISKGKPELPGLPATYVDNEKDANTLEIKLKDVVTNLKASLFYTTFEDCNAITRWAVITNGSDKPIQLNSALSFNIDINHSNFDFMSLNGFWARERHIDRVPLGKNAISIESRRGASGHHHNPFFALLSKNADEENGSVYGFNLVYSGNFLGKAEVDQYDNTRVSMGINPFDFSWQLNPGESFTTPEVVMVYSDKGIGEMSRTFHDLYRKNLVRGNHRDALRPILINNWEATYFDFDKAKIEKLIKESKSLGIELFVLDDGWFGKRNDDKSSLGDWEINSEKLPGGLKDLAEIANKNDMRFGLWFEPEMISPDSNLYREHPDFCLHVPGRYRTEGRNQLVLDLTREQVRENIIDKMNKILDTVPVEYVKWDMNRNMTEIFSSSLPTHRQKETAHRYMLGLYEMMEKITTSHPNILFESCSGGGGRFDPGMLYYMPQTWTSDNTDAIERLKIQYGTSIVYPPNTIGAHVSAVPNHQVHRTTPLETRGNVAMAGNLGYELDPAKLTDNEKQEIKRQVALYKEIRHIIHFGDFYRLRSPFEGNDTAWMFVSKDKKEAVVSFVRVLEHPNPPLQNLRLKGLEADFNYKVLGKEIVLGGDMIMNAGINISLKEGDFNSVMIRLKAEN